VRCLSALEFILRSLFLSIGKDFDLIIGNAPIGGVSGILIKFFKRKPLVSIIYDIDYIRPEAKAHGIFGRFIRKKAFQLMFSLSDRIIVMSKFSRSEVLSMNNSIGDKIDIVEAGFIIKKNMGLENKRLLKELRANKKHPVILFVGVLHPKKGLDYAIRAISKVVKKIGEVQFFIVGPPQEESYLKQLQGLVEREGLTNHVKFLGCIKNQDLWPYYEICDVYVAPSIRTDCFGIPIIEASSFAKAIVSTKLFEDNGVIINNRTGLAVPIKDSEAIAQAIIKLLKDEKLRRKLGENAKCFSKKFSWNDSANKLEMILHKVEENKNLK
jgi:glycosyltransferase involved in cell wall biosynthesis